MSEFQQVNPEMINVLPKNESPINGASERAASFLRVKQSLAVLREQVKKDPGEVFKAFLFYTDNEETRDAVNKLKWELGGRERFKKTCVAEGHDGDKATLVVDYLMGNLAPEENEAKEHDEKIDVGSNTKYNYRYFSYDFNTIVKLSEASDDPTILLEQLTTILDCSSGFNNIDALAQYTDLVASHPRFGELVEKIKHFSNISNSGRTPTWLHIPSYGDGEQSVKFGNMEDAVFSLLRLENREYEALTSEENFVRALSLWTEIAANRSLPLDLLPSVLTVANNEDLGRVFKQYVRNDYSPDRFWRYRDDLNESVDQLKHLLEEKPELLKLEKWGFDISPYIKNPKNPKLIENITSIYERVVDNPHAVENARILGEFGLKISLDVSGNGIFSFAIDSNPDRLRKALTISSLTMKPIYGNSMAASEVRVETANIWDALHDNLADVSLDEVVEAFTPLSLQMNKLKGLDLEIADVIHGVKSGEDLRRRVQTALAPEIQTMASDKEFRKLVFHNRGDWEQWRAFLSDPDMYKDLYRHKEILGQKMELLLQGLPQLRWNLIRTPDLLKELVGFSDDEIVSLCRESAEKHFDIYFETVKKYRLLSSVSQDQQAQLVADLDGAGVSSSRSSLYDNFILPQDLESYFSLSPDQQRAVWSLCSELKEDHDFLLQAQGWGSRNMGVSLGFFVDMVANSETKQHFDAFIDQYKSLGPDERSYLLESYVSLMERHKFQEGFRVEDYVLDTGLPTTRFLDDLASFPRGRENYSLTLLLTDNLLESMDVRERNYWEFWQRYNYQSIHEFVFENSGIIDRLVPDGVMTADFLETFLEWGKQHDMKLRSLFREPHSGSSLEIMGENVLSDEVLIRMSDEDQSFWKLVRYSVVDGGPGLFSFVINNRMGFTHWMKDGLLAESFFDDYVVSEHFSGYSGMWELITDEVLAGMSPKGKEFWGFSRETSSEVRALLIQNRTRFDTYVVGGKATEQLLDDLVDSNKFNLNAALSLLSDELFEQMSSESQLYWSSLKKYSEINIQSFLIAHHKELSGLFEADGSPKITIFEAMAQSKDGQSVIRLLSSLQSIDQSHPQAEFWKYLKTENWSNLESNGDYLYWLLDQRDVFVDHYLNGEQKDIRAVLHRDFVNQIIVTPERISRWETLRLVFDRLRQFPELVRGTSQLRIAEALGVIQLTNRTEVESNIDLQVAFVNLFNNNASSFERRCWNLLRKKLPFTTEEGVRNEMRNQAVTVEEKNSGLLSWVHQAVHNYARAQTPDYIRALSGWVNTGDVKSLDQLKTLAAFYTPDSSPSDDFYTESNRIIVQQAAQTEIETLLDLTARYYEVDPSKLVRMIERNPASLREIAPDLMSDLNRVSESLSAAVSSNQSGGYGQFLSASGMIRQKIMDLTASRSGLQKTELMKLDAVISTLHQQTLPQYLDKYIATEFEKGSLTGEQKDEFIGVFRSTLLSGMLEGDLVRVEDSLKNFGQENLSSESARLHAAVLRFSVELHQANKEWGEFASLAADEMTEMLVRLGHDPSEARSRVIMQDLVNFEKASYKFLLEPMVEMLYRIDQSGSSQALASQNMMFQYEKDEVPLGNDVVTHFLSNLRNNEKIPLETNSMNDLEKVGAFFNRLTEMPFFKVNALCNVLIPGFYDRSSGERQVVGVRMGRDHYEYYPFTHYGVSGAVVLKNGALVEDPLSEIKKIYRYAMVPAMVHAIREGD